MLFPCLTLGPCLQEIDVLDFVTNYRAIEPTGVQVAKVFHGIEPFLGLIHYTLEPGAKYEGTGPGLA